MTEISFQTATTKLLIQESNNHTEVSPINFYEEVV
jgi:hypothetical protein